MNSHNTKPSVTFHKTPVVTSKRAAEAAVLSRSLTIQSELSLDDDFDLGSDPYNATGQHVILSQKLRKD